MATFKDFIVECENYTHSAEHYDLMKECAELNITAQFLENQEFIQDRNFYLQESVTFEEGYFSESVDNETIASIETSFYEKANGIGSKIMNGFKKIATAFMNFFVKISNKFDSQTKAATKIRNELIKHGESYEKEKLDRITAALKKAYESYPIVSSPFGGERDRWDKKLPRNIINANALATQNPGTLFLALSDTYVVVDNQGHKMEDLPLSVEEINEIIKKLSHATGKNDGDVNAEFKSITSYIDDLQKRNDSRGIKINVNAKKMGKVVEELKTTLSDITTREERVKDAIAKNDVSDYKDAIGKKDIAMNAFQLDTVYSRLTAIIGNSLKLYSALYSYRNAAIQNLAQVVLNNRQANDDNGNQKEKEEK